MLYSISSVMAQFFPPKPGFTEKDLPDLHGKVYIVTGSNTGIGKHLARMLYSRNARVYIAARSEEKANAAIAEIQASLPASTGTLVFLHLDLADLGTVKASVNAFLARETKLQVLFNNAGVMRVAEDKSPATTAQGYEIHMGVNCLGTFLLTKLLAPVLSATAKTEPVASVRVVWVSSTIDLVGEKDVGLDLNNLDYKIDKPLMIRYGMSKVGNYLHGTEFARRYQGYQDTGVVSVPMNPGNLSSDLYREHKLLFRVATKPIMHLPVNGAYTMLFAGLSPEVTVEKSGSWVIPFGRFHPIRKDLVAATKPEAEGGNGSAFKFWEWSEKQVQSFL